MGIDGQGNDLLVIDQHPLAGTELRGAQCPNRDGPLGALGIGVVGGVEGDVNSGPVGRGHEVEEHEAVRAARAPDPRAKHGIVDRRHIVHGTVDAVGQQAFIDFEKQVGAAHGATNPRHGSGSLSRILEAGQQRSDRVERFGRAGCGGGGHRGGEFVEPLAVDIGCLRAGSGVGRLQVAPDGSADGRELRHLQTVLTGVEPTKNPSQRGHVGARARRSLLLERGPVEVFLPVLATRAAGQEPVEGADRLAELRRGGSEAALGHRSERLASAERLAAEAGEIGGD